VHAAAFGTGRTCTLVPTPARACLQTCNMCKQCVHARGRRSIERVAAEYQLRRNCVLCCCHCRCLRTEGPAIARAVGMKVAVMRAAAVGMTAWTRRLRAQNGPARSSSSSSSSGKGCWGCQMAVFPRSPPKVGAISRHARAGVMAPGRGFGDANTACHSVLARCTVYLLCVCLCIRVCTCLCACVCAF